MIDAGEIRSGRGSGNLDVGSASPAEEASGRRTPFLRTPHPWASAFSALCRTLESRMAPRETRGEFWQPGGTPAAGPPA